jgi:hypothetical protein
MSTQDIPYSHRRIDKLVEGLSSLLSAKEREQVGARLATNLVEATKAALAQLETIEEQTAPNDPCWSLWVGNLQDALIEADVER